MADYDYNSLLPLIVDNPEAALIPVALLIGVVVKKSKLNDGLIPVAVIVLTALIAFLIDGMTTVAVIKGVIAGAISVAGVTAVKQVSKVSSDTGGEDKPESTDKG